MSYQVKITNVRGTADNYEVCSVQTAFNQCEPQETFQDAEFDVQFEAKQWIKAGGYTETVNGDVFCFEGDGTLVKKIEVVES